MRPGVGASTLLISYLCLLGEPLVYDGIVRPALGASKLTGFISYIYVVPK